jgi:alcohol dehydrogenase
MKAFVYNSFGKKVVEERAKPEINAPTDAIVQITETTIDATDRNTFNGNASSGKSGRIIGNEGVGVIASIGTSVTMFKPGDHVLISCITSCGKCHYCRKLMFSHCTTGGLMLGNTIDGTHAEFVRIPHADTSLYPIPPNSD